jgi:hypothetical protein
MLIYRYLSLEYGIRSLQEKRLRVGRLNDLNDPYDCSPHMIKVPEIAGGENKHFDVGYLAGFSVHFGILCFSATISDPVIWSHYADSHKGIALGFDYPDPRKEDVLKIHYDNNRKVFNYPEIEEIKSHDPVEAMRHLIHEGFTVKAKSWEYESEYRRFVLLEHCTPVGLNYFYDLPIEKLKKIVIGVRSPIAKEDIELTLRKSSYPDGASITKAEIDLCEYRINVSSDFP